MPKKIDSPCLDKYTRYKPLDPNYILEINLILNREPTEDEYKSLQKKCSTNAARVISKNELFIKIVGTCKSFTNIFDVELFEFLRSKKFLYSNITEIILDDDFSYVDNILGFNNFDYFRNYVRRTVSPLNSVKIDPVNNDLDLINSRGLSYFTPTQIASLYGFPTSYNGTGQTIAIIALGGGYRQIDLDAYFQYLGLNPKPTVLNVSVNGAVNAPDYSPNSTEVVLDIEIAGAIANASTIIVYFAPNSFLGFYNAIYHAIVDPRKPSIISISWGAPEVTWGTYSLNTFNNLFAYAAQQGINILAASGDYGSSDGLSGLNVDSPASSPYVVGCGGTSLDSNGLTIQGEVVWPGSGGGLSYLFSKPTYQNNNGIVTTFRCVPDVSGSADPYRGYLIFMNGYWYIVGGTSCVSPLISGLIARLNQQKGVSAGFINPKLYLNQPVALITQGSNGAYSANPNGSYNLCTGLGRIDGSQVIAEL